MDSGGASFTSNLTVDEHAALRSVGFAPVGQVLGSTVYLVDRTNTGCGHVRGDRRPVPVSDLPRTRQGLRDARDRAIERLARECATLGGDGVVGVRLSIRPFHGHALEFSAVGTAVRGAITRPATERPFTSDLSGQDVVKLLRAGWLPVALVVGVGAVVRHDDLLAYTQRSSWRRQELTGLTDLTTAARAQARAALTADAGRHGATTVLAPALTLTVSQVPCRQIPNKQSHDHVAEATMLGTAITPLPDHQRRPADPPPLAMLRLDRDPGRRTRARRGPA
jgi:uncharacterized protein YbjQ (UPF0145 family)